MKLKADSLINFLRNIDFVEVSKENQHFTEKSGVPTFLHENYKIYTKCEVLRTLLKI
ncbi:MAG: hypothetical protein HUU45_12880 [Leptospiraceae bacterium]|nr:hypothetical protein [Leptospiraceae bacterium]